MRCVDERLEVVRWAIRTIRRIEQHTVVTPVAAAGKIGERHQLDCREAGRSHMIELGDGRTKGPRRREGSDVEFEDHGLMPRTPAPIRRLPDMRGMIDDFARPRDILGLKMRRRVRHIKLAVDAEFVERAGAGTIDAELLPAVSSGLHGMRSIEEKIDTLRRRGPETKRNTLRRQHRPELRGLVMARPRTQVRHAAAPAGLRRGRARRWT